MVVGPYVGWCTISCKAQLRVLEQNVTGALYCEIPEQDLVPHVHNHFANNLVLVDDNAVPRRANMVHEYQSGEDIMHIDLPLYSPDMKTIQHMWDEFRN